MFYKVFVNTEGNEQRRLDHGLQIAREIQGILLPAEAPDVKGFELDVINIPARQVGGDKYDVARTVAGVLGDERP